MSINKRFFLLITLLLSCFNAQALNLSPFNVRYHVYRGDIHVANSQFSFKQQNSEWVWYMQTSPRGIYSWLTSKKPFAETRIQQPLQEIQLLLEMTGDYPDKPAEQNTWFDHQNKKIYSMNGSQISNLEMKDNIYNYHSVQLLYPLMLEHNETQKTINFYKRGKLIESTLTLEKQVELPSKKDKIIVDKVTQAFKDSNNTMIYYYQGETLAPLKIEQVKPGKDSSVMWRVDSR